MKGKIFSFILAVIILAGISLMAYPMVSNWWNTNHTSRAIAQYKEHIAQIDTKEAEAEIEKAREYNKRMNQTTDKTEFIEQNQEEYLKLLNIDGSGIMGYIDIPSIQVTLPIYHGTADSVLQVAAGHLEWTSLPVGGEGTHTAISGHRGLPSAKLFTDLDAMQTGDVYTIHIYHEVYYYQVDDISVILPEETTSLVPTAGEDYCTLITCTPYGINSHRLLVRGKRIFPTFTDETIHKDVRVIPRAVIAGGTAGVILFIGGLMDIIRIKKRKRFRRKGRSNRKKEGTII